MTESQDRQSNTVRLRLPPALRLRDGRVHRGRAAARTREREPPPRLSRRFLRARTVSVLEVRDPDVIYRRQDIDAHAVVGASLALERGRIAGLVGESGCGKPSLSRAVVGFVKPAAGEIVFEGTTLALLRRGARPAHVTRLQMVLQNYSSLNPRRTIGSQIGDGLRFRGEKDGGARRTRVGVLLEQVGMAAGAAGRFPHQFSGGQRRRIAIARAAGPSVIVLDEPPPPSTPPRRRRSRTCSSGSPASSTSRSSSSPTTSDRPPHRGLGLGDVPRHDRRRGPDARGVGGAEASLHRGPDRRDSRGRRRRHTPGALPGEVPDPSSPPSGCRFHPRCPYVFERCPGEEPPIYPAGPAQTSAASCATLVRTTNEGAT